MVIAKFKKWGNSLRIIFPKAVIKSENLKENQLIELVMIRKYNNEFTGYIKKIEERMKTGKGVKKFNQKEAINYIKNL